MEGPLLTEERLRNHLDANQARRESMCLALLPLLGPYTQERPRRPKGGPDGGRDIEALHEGSTEIWGAVGFRNGGGNSDEARRDAQKKFDDDLTSALTTNPTLRGFVFFTNVDLTPGIIEGLKKSAAKRDIAVIDIFDFERLRHVLDSPEGLIARLQYLGIPMSSTEQISLVSKFGNALQNAILSRFDRVERTLAQMEHFVALQKPVHRLDIFIQLKHQNCCSKDLGNEAALLCISGFPNDSDKCNLLCINQPNHKYSTTSLVTRTRMWMEHCQEKLSHTGFSLASNPGLFTSFCELSLTTHEHRVRLADLTCVDLSVYLTHYCPANGRVNLNNS